MGKFMDWWEDFTKGPAHPININDFTQQVAKIEGGKKSVDIAQLSEVTKIILTLLSTLDERTVRRTLRGYRDHAEELYAKKQGILTKK